MATITPSYNSKNQPNGKWKVQFRRKGIKHFCMNFNTKKEAIDWAKEHEFKFIENPELYYTADRLKLRRQREKERN